MSRYLFCQESITELLVLFFFFPLCEGRLSDRQYMQPIQWSKYNLIRTVILRVAWYFPNLVGNVPPQPNFGYYITFVEYNLFFNLK